MAGGIRMNSRRRIRFIELKPDFLESLRDN